MNNWLLTSSLLLTVIASLFIGSSYADSIPSDAQIINTVNSQNYSDTAYYQPNSPESILHIWQSHNPRLADSTGSYNSPYLVYDNGPSYTIASGEGTYVYDKNTCGIKFYDPTKTPNSSTNIINSISFIVQQTDNPNATSYDSNSVNSASCTTTKTDDGNFLKITGTKSSPDGTFVTEYTMLADQPMEYKASFYPSINQTHYYVITESQDGIPSTVPVDVSNGTKLVSNNNEMSITNLVNQTGGLAYGNNGFYDLENAQQYLHKSSYIKNPDGTQHIYNDFMSSNAISQGDSFSIDPTFGYSSPIWKQIIQGNNIVSSSCATASYSLFSAANTTTGAVDTLSNAGAGNCQVAAYKWDVSSIPVGSTINSTTFKHDITAQVSPSTCDYVQILSNWVTQSNSTKYNNIASSPVTYVSASTDCQSNGVGKTIILGSTANTDVHNQLSSGYFNLGIKYNPFSRDATSRSTTFANSQLQIIYTWTPSAPTLIHVNTLSTSSINSTWTKPFTALWYLVFRESPTGGGFSQVANTTNQFFLDTGRAAGTQYNYKIFAGNTNGYNATAPSNQLSNYTFQVAPTALTATPLSSTSERIGWTNPSGNMSGFKVEKSLNNSTWSTVTSNTNNSTNRYDLTGLTAGTLYYSRISTNWGTGPQAGTSSPSHVISFYTLNNPPTPATATSQAGLQILVSWTSPGNTITGYRIDVSVNGGAYSTLVANTTTTSTSYLHTGLINGNTYTYKIYTLDPAGTSLTAATTNTATAGDVPSQIFAPSITLNNTSPAIITWVAPSSNSYAINGYRIDVSINNGPFTIAVANTTTTATTYSYVINIPRTIYEWRIEALNALGTGPLGVPSAPVTSGDAPTIPATSTTPTTFRNLNTTLINLQMSSIPRNGTGYDTFTLDQDNWLWLKFDNTTTDSSSIGIGSGTVAGVTTYVTGKYNQAFSFNNSTSIIYGNNENFENNSPFTITVWIKTSETNHREVIMSKEGSLNAQGYDLRINTNNKLLFTLINTASTNELAVAGSVSLTDGNWHYVVVTYDGSKSPSGVKLYEDNVLDPSMSTPFNTLTGSILNTNNFELGSFQDGSSPFNGLIDNAKIYPYSLSSSQINSDFSSISVISSGKQFMSWYHGNSGSATLVQRIGTVRTPLTLTCNLDSSKNSPIISNVTNIFYQCITDVRYVNIINTTDHHYFTSAFQGTLTHGYLFSTIQHIFSASFGTTGDNLNSIAGNQTAGGESFQTTNQKLQKTSTTTSGLKYYQNVTTLQTVSVNPCEINFSPTNATKVIDPIACDNSLPAKTIRYWQGMSIIGNANYATNTTQQFLVSVDVSPYKKLLSMPCHILVNESPCSTFIMTDFTNTDYFIVLTSTHIYYKDAQTALFYLNHNNYGFQSYDIITQFTDTTYPIQNPILQPMKLYGLNTNITLSKAGLFTLPSPYTVKMTSIESAIRTIDPRWTNDNTDIPIISTSGSLFPIILTVTNAPQFSAIKVTSPTQVINAQESVWSVAQLDSTKTVEFDLPPGTCANIYIADISIAPSIWNSQGNICATGLSQKTITYTNTLPITFFSNNFGVSHAYTSTSNILTTTVRSATVPYTYTIVLKNSTGGVALNSTFTSINALDQQSFNVSGIVKPAGLSVYTNGNLVYSAYLGSALSLSTTMAFFHQYLSYQGFDLLSFIPLVFAAMFTRNTVGIGTALTVVLIATLSWLSIVVIPDQDVVIMIVIAAIAMVGYRQLYQ